MILTKCEIENIQNIVDKIIYNDMEECGSITEIEKIVKQQEINGYEYKISVKVERIMEDEE